MAHKRRRKKCPRGCVPVEMVQASGAPSYQWPGESFNGLGAPKYKWLSPKPRAERAKRRAEFFDLVVGAATSLLVKWEGDAPYHTTLEEFCADNAQDAEACAKVRALREGESVWFGGGAAPLVQVTRVARRA